MSNVGKPTSVQTRSLIWFEYCTMVLRMNPTANESIIELIFPVETRNDKFECLYGNFLASYQLSRQLFNEDPDILVFEIDEISTNKVTLEI